MQIVKLRMFEKNRTNDKLFKLSESRKRLCHYAVIIIYLLQQRRRQVVIKYFFNDIALKLESCVSGGFSVGVLFRSSGCGKLVSEDHLLKAKQMRCSQD